MLTLNLNLLYTVVNVLILFLLLRKFLYKPVTVSYTHLSGDPPELLGGPVRFHRLLQ